MLPSSHRLPSPVVRTVLQGGRRLSHPPLQIIFKKNNSGISRFAVVVPKGFDKRATARNRSRRLIHESLFKLLTTIASGWDAVIFVRKGLPDSQIQVESILGELLKRASII